MSESTKNFKCEICEKHFQLKKTLSWHVITNHRGHEAKKKIECECEICGKSFEYNINLTQHKNLVHGQLKKNPCAHCGKEFSGTTRDGDRYLEQTPFCFLPWGCPLFQVGHSQFEFPATYS